MKLETIYVAAPIRRSRLLVGKVHEMQLVGHTMAFTEDWLIEVDQAHLQATAREPAPLVGEGELEQKRLLQEIVELEAADDREWRRWKRTKEESPSERKCLEEMKRLGAIIKTKRSELDALTNALAHRPRPSPTSAVGSANRSRPHSAAPCQKSGRRAGSAVAPRNGVGGWRVLLQDDTDNSGEVTLPFTPFQGLWLRVPWHGFDYFQIGEVYWQDDEDRFHVFMTGGGGGLTEPIETDRKATATGDSTNLTVVEPSPKLPSGGGPPDGHPRMIGRETTDEQ